MKKYIIIMLRGKPYRIEIDEELDKNLKYSLKEDYKFDNNGYLITNKNTLQANYLIKQKLFSNILKQIETYNLPPEFQERIDYLKSYINLKKSDIYNSDLTKLEELLSEATQIYGTVRNSLVKKEEVKNNATSKEEVLENLFDNPAEVEDEESDTENEQEIARKILLEASQDENLAKEITEEKIDEALANIIICDSPEEYLEKTGQDVSVFDLNLYFENYDFTKNKKIILPPKTNLKEVVYRLINSNYFEPKKITPRDNSSYKTSFGKKLNALLDILFTNGFNTNNINYYSDKVFKELLEAGTSSSINFENLFKGYFNGEKNDLTLFMHNFSKYTGNDETLKRTMERVLLEQAVQKRFISSNYLNYVNSGVNIKGNASAELNYKISNNIESSNSIESTINTESTLNTQMASSVNSQVESSTNTNLNINQSYENSLSGNIKGNISSPPSDNSNNEPLEAFNQSAIPNSAKPNNQVEVKVNSNHETSGVKKSGVNKEEAQVPDQVEIVAINPHFINNYAKPRVGAKINRNISGDTNIEGEANARLEASTNRRMNGAFSQRIVDEDEEEAEPMYNDDEQTTETIEQNEEQALETENESSNHQENAPTRSATSNLSDAAKDKVKDEVASHIRNEIGKEATKKVGKEAAKGAVKKAGGKFALGALLKNPYFWIVVGIIVLIIILIVLISFVVEQNEQEKNNLSYYGTFNNGAYWWPIGSAEPDSNGLYSGDPVSVIITSYFGPRDIGLEGASTNHGAIDIGGVGNNTPIIATRSGTVTKVEGNCKAGNSTCGGRYGNYVEIDHGNGVTSLYAHMSSTAVNVGDTVVGGQLVGISGGTGNVTGPHLHFEIKINGEKVDPLNYVDPNNPRPVYGYVNGISLEFVEFLHSWEGTGGGATDEYYTVYADPGGVLTVGYGVTLIYNEPLFTARGLNINNIKAGDRINRELIDSIEYEILAGKLTSVQNTVNSCNAGLNEKQIYALLSRMYNVGNISSFCENYNSYGITQALYNNYMKNPVTQNGKVLNGLIRRREAEWQLFYNGIYVNNG